MEVTVLFHHPEKSAREQGPAELEYEDKYTGEKHSYWPSTDPIDGTIAYVVPLKFAARLLGYQPDRYFLLDPPFLKFNRPLPGHPSEWISVKSIRGTAEFEGIKKVLEAETSLDSADLEMAEKKHLHDVEAALEEKSISKHGPAGSESAKDELSEMDDSK